MAGNNKVRVCSGILALYLSWKRNEISREQFKKYVDNHIAKFHDEKGYCRAYNQQTDLPKSKPKPKLKEYVIGLFTWLPNGEETMLDETSVDASNEEEAYRIAEDLFLEFAPHLDRDFVRENMRILEVRELSEEELKEIEG